MCTATGRAAAATIQGETAAAAGRLGLAPVHKEVTKKINSELVPVCFQIQGDTATNKIGVRATILPVLGSKTQVNGGCTGNALWSQVAACWGYNPSAAPQHLGLNPSLPTDPCPGVPSSEQTQGMGRCGSTPLSSQPRHDLTSNHTRAPFGARGNSQITSPTQPCSRLSPLGGSLAAPSGREPRRGWRIFPKSAQLLR